jgi:hypothetical protein
MVFQTCVCRLDKNPKTSATDPLVHIHDLYNLYIGIEILHPDAGILW